MGATTITRHVCDRCGHKAEVVGNDAPIPDDWEPTHDPDERPVAICPGCRRSFRSWWMGHGLPEADA